MLAPTLLFAALLAAPAAAPSADPQPAATAKPARQVARHRVHHVRAIDAVAAEAGWRFYDGTVGRPYQLLGSLTRRAGTEAWEVHDHVGRLLGTIEPHRDGWTIHDDHHTPIAAATAAEIRCPNGRRHQRHAKLGFPDIAMQAFFGPDAE